MPNLLALIVAGTLLGACAHNGDMPTVRAGNDADPAKARAGGRIAGAGGSNAPGGETFSGVGSAR